jgi:hypothetical protein
MTDLVARLRAAWWRAPQDTAPALEAAIAEIERLRAALALAVGELSTHSQHRLTTPDMLMQQFLEEARRG